jgi:hypothetical protein
MSRNTKIILIIVGVLVALCLCGCGLAFVLLRSVGTFMEQSMVTEPDQVQQVGAKIADYETPPGYSQKFGMSFFGFDLVGLASGDEQNGVLIFMMQFPAWANMDEAQMEEQLQQSVGREMNTQDLNLTVVDQSTVTIRDQQVTLTTREGTNKEDVAVRQITGLFQGKDGPTMLMIMGDTATWDQAAIDTFIASIH